MVSFLGLHELHAENESIGNMKEVFHMKKERCYHSSQRLF